MISILPSQCEACRHLRASGWQCDAFPTGIPVAMLTQGGDHRDPLPGDHGVRFERRAGAEAAEAFEQWERTFG